MFIRCEQCNGSGGLIFDAPLDHTCWKCNGIGKIEVLENNKNGELSMTKQEKIESKLRLLDTDYWHVCLVSETVCLDGDFSVEQLKLFIELLENKE